MLNHVEHAWLIWDMSDDVAMLLVDFSSSVQHVFFEVALPCF